MPEQNILTTSKYAKLVKDIRTLIEEGRARAESAARQELVTTYWEVGKRLVNEGLTKKTSYGESILYDMADELKIEYTTLTRAMDFFQKYNLAPTGKNLSWSQYRELAVIPDKQERDWYEDLASTEGLNRDELVTAIRSDLYHEKSKAKRKGAKKEELKRPTEASHVYKAKVQRVIDGDTIILMIDLGFLVWREQRIRFLGIDCAPIDTPKGQEAYRYVRDQLAKVDFVMVKTHQWDKYGRYLGHIFYSFTENNKDKVFVQGRYLNQELLDRGLARRM